MTEFYNFDEAREAWGKLHSGLRKHGMESEVIDTLISYFGATPIPPIGSEDLRALMQEAHDTMHECTAVLTANDCNKVAAVMTRIRAALAQVQP